MERSPEVRKRRDDRLFWLFIAVGVVAVAGLLSSGELAQAVVFLPAALYFAVDSVVNFRTRWRRPADPPEQLKGVSRSWWRDWDRATLPMAVFCPSALLLIAVGVLAEATAGSVTQPFQIVLFVPAMSCVGSALLGLATFWFGVPQTLVPPALRGRGPVWSGAERSND